MAVGRWCYDVLLDGMYQALGLKAADTHLYPTCISKQQQQWKEHHNSRRSDRLLHPYNYHSRFSLTRTPPSIPTPSHIVTASPACAAWYPRPPVPFVRLVPPSRQPSLLSPPSRHPVTGRKSFRALARRRGGWFRAGPREFPPDNLAVPLTPRRHVSTFMANDVALAGVLIIGAPAGLDKFLEFLPAFSPSPKSIF